MSIKLSPAQALAYAQASQRIEGTRMSDEAVELARRMLAGELTYDEVRERLLAAANHQADSRPKRS